MTYRWQLRHWPLTPWRWPTAGSYVLDPWPLEDDLPLAATSLTPDPLKMTYRWQLRPWPWPLEDDLPLAATSLTLTPWRWPTAGSYVLDVDSFLVGHEAEHGEDDESREHGRAAVDEGYYEGIPAEWGNTKSDKSRLQGNNQWRIARIYIYIYSWVRISYSWD